MAEFAKLDRAVLESLRASLQTQFDAVKAKGLKLDMTRGKPGADQLDLSNGLLTCLRASDYKALGDTDCRNYGGLDGLPEAKALLAPILDVSPNALIIGGNSSLNLMHDTIVRAVTHGVPGGTPWGKLPKAKCLCPSPGYDRHFTICGHFGIEMIVVDMKDDGPDMDAVERLAGADEAIKAIWCVPKYSNPTGVTYSDAVVNRLAAMRTKAPDFRILWDNAYAIHHLTDTPDHLASVLEACQKAGNPQRPLLFSSTSKISFAGAGLALMGGSEENMAWAKKHLSVQTIGPDKINQLRHVRFFQNMDGLLAHMAKHAAILRPKFEAVRAAFDSHLAGKGIAAWSRPKGGYFVSLDTPDGCAKAVVARANEAGVKLTPAGATFPHGKDPRDRNIRIAPTMPPIAEVEQAMEVVCLAVQLVSLEKLMGQ
jgi:DNA-binding transcriptional MocR family regulator